MKSTQLTCASATEIARPRGANPQQQLIHDSAYSGQKRFCLIAFDCLTRASK
jgi:hypothetical protein